MHRGFAPILVLIIGLAIVLVGSVSYFQLKPKTPPVPESVSLATPTPADETVYTDPGSANRKTYKDTKISFTYPSTWEVLQEIPKEYRTIEFDINQEGWDKLHLKSKMFGSTCRGPILRNTRVKSTIIAFEIIDTSYDGAFCWSRGDFTNTYSRTIQTLTPPQEIKVSKWTTGDYIYPVTPDSSGTRYKAPWEGILFLQEAIDSSDKKKIAVVALVYQDNTDNTAESTYDQILSTFRFLE